MNTKRLEYIDILRSVAILMMLEGHFITHSLQTIYRDASNPIYEFWKFTRGLTAPLFLSISGLIFTFLLLKNKKQGWQNLRVQKGIKRGLTLIAIGYLLQFNLYTYFFAKRPLFTSLTQIFHVLQCIGTSLLFLIGFYLLKTYVLKIPLGLVFSALGLLVAMVTPTLYSLDYTGIPRFIENLLITSSNTKLQVSVFPLFPWCAYVFFGAALGCLVYQLKNKAQHFLFPVGLIAAGILLPKVLYFTLENIQQLPFFNQLIPFQYTYEPIRFCQVMLFMGTIILVEKICVLGKEKGYLKIPKTVFTSLLVTAFGLGCYWFCKPITTNTHNLLAYSCFFIPILIGLWKVLNWNYQTFIKIGQNTLAVYVLHVILLYQGLLGLRINVYIKQSFSPFFAILGAMFFVFFFLAITEYQAVFVTRAQRLKRRWKIIQQKTGFRVNAA